MVCELVNDICIFPFHATIELYINICINAYTEGGSFKQNFYFEMK